MRVHRITVTARGRRYAEPVFFEIPEAVSEPLWTAQGEGGGRFVCQRLSAGSTSATTRFVAVVDMEDSFTFELVAPTAEQVAGIEVGPATEADGAFQLDTGYFFMEMCRGTGEGRGESKWGLRHFGRSVDRVDLIPSGNNAIGGFYGPFFTPENGLVNPPEHCVVEITPVEVGPLLHHYRMHGVIPDGLLPELADKSFTIDWTFTHGSDFYTRTYRVDDFETVVNGRAIVNKITVGDEFEAGQGAVTFDRFDSELGVVYRPGDPYAKLLADGIAATLAEDDGERLEEFRAALGDGIEGAHWDLYWKLFCAREHYLPVEELTSKLTEVRRVAHSAADHPARIWRFSSSAVNVSAVTDETIFAGPAVHTAEFDSMSGRCMVWVTSQPSDAFQIVQRPQSGWVNWGTNSENECPGLPTGAEIKSALGGFGADWRSRAATLAEAPSVIVRTE
jgi:hypothetical protein